RTVAGSVVRRPNEATKGANGPAALRFRSWGDRTRARGPWLHWFGREATETNGAGGGALRHPEPSQRGGRLARKPMLDSPRLELAVRRGPLHVEDLRSTTVVDDTVQRRDLFLPDRARGGAILALTTLLVDR